MKTIKMITVILFLVATSGMVKAQTEEVKKVKATFLEITDDDEYIFEIDNGKTIIFQEISDEFDVILDEENVGIKYEVSYTEEEVDEFDDEGNVSNSYFYRIITGLKEL